MNQFYKNCNGAEFSDCRKYRYALWRIWDNSKPFVMFIGLNPSTANEHENDPTIRSVSRIANANGYGGFFMMNCYPLVSTKPEKLYEFYDFPYHTHEESTNNAWLKKVAALCKDIVFAWGAFEVVKEIGRDKELIKMFPNAMALGINKDGSPKHPLYCKSDTQFIPFNQ